MGQYLSLLQPAPTTSCADVLQDELAVALLCRLESEGFIIMLAGRTIDVEPFSGLNLADRAALKTHTASLAMLVRIADDGVLERQVIFARQLTAAPPGEIPAMVLEDATAPRLGACFSCAESLEAPRMGRCWRCAIAWRLAARIGVPAQLPEVEELVAGEV